ncbi:hypothetical protein [Rugamonas sp.]|nr:hypothetical protein [Rugamonas sp.]
MRAAGGEVESRIFGDDEAVDQGQAFAAEHKGADQEVGMEAEA